MPLILVVSGVYMFSHGTWLLTLVVTSLSIYGTNQQGFERSLSHGISLKKFGTQCDKNGFSCRGQLAAQGHKSPRQSKTNILVSWPHLDDQVEAFQVWVFQEY